MSISIPARVIVTTGSSAGFILAFLAMFEPGDRVGIANPGYPPYRHILKALGCEPVLIETGDATRWAVTPEAVLAEHRKRPARRTSGREPGQSDRHHDAAGRARGTDSDHGGGGHPVHLRRNLSWPRLCIPGRDRVADFGPVAGDQFVLEIFLHDRLAHRLDRGARAAGAADRAAAGQSRDQRADPVADRGGSRVRRPRRDGRRQARLRGQPPHPDRGIAEGRARNIPAGRRRLLSLCQCGALLRRLATTSPSACWKRRMSRPRPASISIRSTGGIICASVMRSRRPTCTRRWRASARGCARDERCRPDPRRCRAPFRRCSVWSRAMSTASPFWRCSDSSPRR